MKMRYLVGLAILVSVGCTNKSSLTGSLASLDGSGNGASSAPPPPVLSTPNPTAAPTPVVGSPTPKPTAPPPPATPVPGSTPKPTAVPTAVPVSHSATIAWNASTSTVTGYFIYRSTTNGGPYTKLNATAQTALTYTDSSVQGGVTYYYVTTAVNSSNVESSYSNQISVTIP
jgi:hypothetical protein